MLEMSSQIPWGLKKKHPEISNYNKQYIELWVMSEEPMNKNLTISSFAKAVISLNYMKPDLVFERYEKTLSPI